MKMSCKRQVSDDENVCCEIAIKCKGIYKDTCCVKCCKFCNEKCESECIFSQCDIDNID